MRFGEGKFIIGCNYWASHAGIRMWSDWQPEVVEADFGRLAALDIEIVRIFPLWPDFQPLHILYGAGNVPYEFSWPGDRVIEPEADGTLSGVDPEMVERLRFVCDAAHKYQLKVGIGLVTGWMSGRLFAPPAFEGRNLLTDPLVTRWQLRLVRKLVREFKDHPALAYWGIGNECNCMSVSDREESNLWADLIATAIRVEDRGHQVASGLHGTLPEARNRIGGVSWTIQDMGDIFDCLTTHPYPAFTPYSAVDRITGIKNLFHSASESRLYATHGLLPMSA